VQDTIPVVIPTDDGQSETRDLGEVERDPLTPPTLGLPLAAGQAMLKAVEECPTSIENHKSVLPKDGERYRQGERISTGFVVSTGHQVISKRCCKQQPMAWPQRGAHLLLPSRPRVLHGDWAATLREGSPGFRASPQRVAA
jgi:hypothetical protein